MTPVQRFWRNMVLRFIEVIILACVWGAFAGFLGEFVGRNGYFPPFGVTFALVLGVLAAVKLVKLVLGLLGFMSMQAGVKAVGRAGN